MDYLELNRKLCRICLNVKGVVNWNDDIFELSGISYKNCYYKYTQLTRSNSDAYPTNLCEVCAIELKNAHLLFKKALESFDILQDAFTAKELKGECFDLELCRSQPTVECQRTIFDEDKPAELSVDRHANDNAYDNESLAETENAINNSKEIYMTDSAIIEPSHFIDMRNFESPAVILLDQNVIESCDTDLQKLSDIKIISGKRKKVETSPVTSLEQQLGGSCGSALVKSSPATKKTSKKRKKLDTSLTNLKGNLGEKCNKKSRKSLTSKSSRKNNNKSESLTDISLELQMSENCDIDLPKTSFTKEIGNIKKQESSADLALENISENCDRNSPVSSTKKPAENSRSKYLLMCAYCSLKVQGAMKLKKHEATHSEHRIRTETCPQCGLKLYTKLALKSHMKVHDANRQKNHKCEFCEKAFYYRGALNVHRRIHLGLMVSCQICSREFYRQVDLNKHLLKHSASPLQKNVEQIKYAVQCQYCNKSVLTTTWKEHKAAHLNQPQVKCKICDKNFFSRSKCAKHLRRVHHKIKCEYDEFIHHFDDCHTRMSRLMMKQQEKVQPLTE